MYLIIKQLQFKSYLKSAIGIIGNLAGIHIVIKIDTVVRLIENNAEPKIVVAMINGLKIEVIIAHFKIQS